MIIKRLKIQNYRGIKQATILFPGHTLLVGNNNVGKSTICEAIDLLIGPERLSRYPVIDEHDFYQSMYLDEDEQPIEIVIEAVIGNLNGEQQRKFRGNLEFWDNTSNDILEAENPTDTDRPEVEPIIRVAFIGKYSPDEDEFEGQTFYCHPLNAEGKQPYFKKEDKRICGFLFLRTLRTGTRALSLEKGSLLDVILRLKDSRPKMWENILQTLRNVNPPIDDVPELKEILSEIESRVKQYIPLSEQGKSTKFYVSNLTREHLRKTVSFFAASAPCPALLPFNHLGTGTINTLVFSLLTCIADLKDNVIFAMEEPEIAIPPHTQRRVVQYLLKNSQQVFFTSHSPYVIEQFEPENILVLDRSNDGVVNALPATLPSGLKPKTYQRNLRKQIAESLLGNGVLIVEGDTEADLFPVASSILERNENFTSIDLAGVTIINAGGEGDISRYANFFKSIGKTTFAFFDKQTNEQNKQAIQESVDYPIETNYLGIEKLLVALIPINLQKQLLVDISQPCADDTDTQAREVLESTLKRAKGERLAARLISMCNPEQLPTPIVEILTTISSVMTVTPQIEDAAEPEGGIDAEPSTV